jgi:hypothetical protein
MRSSPLADSAARHSVREDQTTRTVTRARQIAASASPRTIARFT